MKISTSVVVADVVALTAASVHFPSKSTTEKVDSKAWSWIEVLTIPVPSSLYDNRRAEQAKTDTRNWGKVYWDLDYWQEFLADSLPDDKIW
jgi:hypothetical protein